jgi:hypothetical protein
MKNFGLTALGYGPSVSLEILFFRWYGSLRIPKMRTLSLGNGPGDDSGKTSLSPGLTIIVQNLCGHRIAEQPSLPQLLWLDGLGKQTEP